MSSGTHPCGRPLPPSHLGSCRFLELHSCPRFYSPADRLLGKQTIMSAVRPVSTAIFFCVGQEVVQDVNKPSWHLTPVQLEGHRHFVTPFTAMHSPPFQQPPSHNTVQHSIVHIIVIII